MEAAIESLQDQAVLLQEAGKAIGVNVEVVSE